MIAAFGGETVTAWEIHWRHNEGAGNNPVAEWQAALDSDDEERANRLEGMIRQLALDVLADKVLMARQGPRAIPTSDFITLLELERKDAAWNSGFPVAVDEAAVEAYAREHVLPLVDMAPEVVTLQMLLRRLAWDEDAKGTLERTVAAIAAGDLDFSEAARQISHAPSAPSGGLMAGIPTSALPPAVQEALEGLEVGEISPVLANEGGFFVVQLVARDDREASRWQVAVDAARSALEGEERRRLMAKAVGVPSYDMITDEAREATRLRMGLVGDPPVEVVTRLAAITQFVNHERPRLAALRLKGLSESEREDLWVAIRSSFPNRWTGDLHRLMLTPVPGRGEAWRLTPRQAEAYAQEKLLPWGLEQAPGFYDGHPVPEGWRLRVEPPRRVPLSLPDGEGAEGTAALLNWTADSLVMEVASNIQRENPERGALLEKEDVPAAALEAAMLREIQRQQAEELENEIWSGVQWGQGL